MPDDHSKLDPPLPIPNRTVKRHCADDSAETSVKVGYRQANILKKPLTHVRGFFLFHILHLFLLFGLSSLHSLLLLQAHLSSLLTSLVLSSFYILRDYLAR